jgi:hypothetical protein
MSGDRFQLFPVTFVKSCPMRRGPSTRLLRSPILRGSSHPAATHRRSSTAPPDGGTFDLAVTRSPAQGRDPIFRTPHLLFHAPLAQTAERLHGKYPGLIGVPPRTFAGRSRARLSNLDALNSAPLRRVFPLIA